MIRELHVYGKVAKIGGESQHENKFQHRGFGRQLMEMAEQISQTQGYQKLTVIA